MTIQSTTMKVMISLVALSYCVSAASGSDAAATPAVFEVSGCEDNNFNGLYIEKKCTEIPLSPRMREIFESARTVQSVSWYQKNDANGFCWIWRCDQEFTHPKYGAQSTKQWYMSSYDGMRYLKVNFTVQPVFRKPTPNMPPASGWQMHPKNVTTPRLIGELEQRLGINDVDVSDAFTIDELEARFRKNPASAMTVKKLRECDVSDQLLYTLRCVHKFIIDPSGPQSE